MYLLHTSVVIELRKRACNPALRAWHSSVEGAETYLSSLVIGEITQRIERLSRRDVPQATLLSDWLNELMEECADRIVPVGGAAALIWGRWSGAWSRLPAIDGLMAATAYLNDWTFVTRNTKDVAQTGVRTLNPFEPMPTSS
ncbi:hypothetical protein GCM10029978_016240 [Actinoallomurus acanthiterrae]